MVAVIFPVAYPILCITLALLVFHDDRQPFIVIAEAVTTPNAAPSSAYWYRLTNTFTGPSLSLDIVNDGGLASSGTLQMAASGDFSGQYWQLIHFPTPSSTTYALYTEFLGPGKRLDVYGNDKTMPHLGGAGNFSGQVWTIAPWGDGTWQLTNQYSGSGLHLDVYSGTLVPFMGNGDHSGQHWAFTPLASAGSASATPLTSVAVASATTLTPTASGGYANSVLVLVGTPLHIPLFCLGILPTVITVIYRLL